MRKVFGYILFVLGLMFAFLAVFLVLYTVPRVEKAPTDVDQTVTSDGAGEYFSAQRLAYVGPVSLEAIERYKGDPQASTDTVAVINYQNHLIASDTGGDIDFDKEVYAMDRTTGEAVNCCGEQPKHSGLELKFPFGTEKKTYQLWDGASDAAYPAEFVGVETIQGTEVYRFHSETGDVQMGFLDLPGTVLGRDPGNVEVERMYNASIDAWAEPVTGAIVKGSKHVEQWAAENGTRLIPLADLTVTYNEPTVTKLIDDAKDAKKSLAMVKTTLPIVLPIIGIILAVIGFLLLREPKGKAKPKPMAVTGTTADDKDTVPAKPARTSSGSTAMPAKPAKPAKPAEA
jgi:hypothetical protein